MIKNISGFGENHDWEKFNWFEIRQMSRLSFEDSLNVMLSWMTIFEYLSFAFAFTSISFVFLSLEITLLLFFISLFFHALQIYLLQKQERTREKFEIKIEIIDNQIERLTGMKLPKLKFD
jgi:hypothetical protein